MPDIKKLKKLINWIPDTDLQDGIKKTIGLMNENRHYRFRSSWISK